MRLMIRLSMENYNMILVWYLSSGKIGKYEYLTGAVVLPSNQK